MLCNTLTYYACILIFACSKMGFYNTTFKLLNMINMKIILTYHRHNFLKIRCVRKNTRTMSKQSQKRLVLKLIKIVRCIQWIAEIPRKKQADFKKQIKVEKKLHLPVISTDIPLNGLNKEFFVLFYLLKVIIINTALQNVIFDNRQQKLCGYKQNATKQTVNLKKKKRNAVP